MLAAAAVITAVALLGNERRGGLPEPRSAGDRRRARRRRRVLRRRHPAGPAAVPRVPAVRRDGPAAVGRGVDGTARSTPTTARCGRPARSTSTDVADDAHRDRGWVPRRTARRHDRGGRHARHPAGGLHACRARTGERLPGAVHLDGAAADQVLGVPTVRAVAQRADLNDALALVNLTDPVEGERRPATRSSLGGRANSFEAQRAVGDLRARRAGRQEGCFTASGMGDRLYPWVTEIDVSGLDAGHLHPRGARPTDPSGGGGPRAARRHPHDRHRVALDVDEDRAMTAPDRRTRCSRPAAAQTSPGAATTRSRGRGHRVRRASTHAEPTSRPTERARRAERTAGGRRRRCRSTSSATPRRARACYREFRKVEADDPLDEAVALMTAGDALDPDYGTLYPGGDLRRRRVRRRARFAVELAGRRLDRPADRHDRRRGQARRPAARLHAPGRRAGAAPGGRSTSTAQPTTLFGVDTADGVRTRPGSSTSSAWSTSPRPRRGDRQRDTFTASGVASSFEATVPWEIRDGAARSSRRLRHRRGLDATSSTRGRPRSTSPASLPAPTRSSR